MKKIALFLFISATFCSCAFLFNSMVFPNQCTSCQVIDSFNGDVLFENEGCGGSNVNIEDDAKVQAFELSRNGTLCDLDVVCEHWKEEVQE